MPVAGGAGSTTSPIGRALAQTGHVPVAANSLVYGRHAAARYQRVAEGDLADTQLVRSVLREQRTAAVMTSAACAGVGGSMKARVPRSPR